MHVSFALTSHTCALIHTPNLCFYGSFLWCWLYFVYYNYIKTCLQLPYTHIPPTSLLRTLSLQCLCYVLYLLTVLMLNFYCFCLCLTAGSSKVYPHECASPMIECAFKSDQVRSCYVNTQHSFAQIDHYTIWFHYRCFTEAFTYAVST